MTRLLYSTCYEHHERIDHKIFGSFKDAKSYLDDSIYQYSISKFESGILLI